MKNIKNFSIFLLLIMSVFLVFVSSCEKDDDDDKGISGTPFTDPRDGKVYQTVVIGNQEWMAENLAYAPSGGNYWAYDNDDANVEIYGYLYDWETALDVCPTGWHLPSDAEWTELTDYLGGTGVADLGGPGFAGEKLKETGTTHWISPNSGATNESGFTALPGGYRNSIGYFEYIGSNGYWWSATEDYPDRAWNRSLSYHNSYVYRISINKFQGFSVRCLRD